MELTCTTETKICVSLQCNFIHLQRLLITIFSDFESYLPHDIKKFFFFLVFTWCADEDYVTTCQLFQTAQECLFNRTSQVVPPLEGRPEDNDQ